MPKILAIDDKQDNLLVLQAILKSFMPDCTLFKASSGQEGVKIATGELPDVILLDIKMPGMDGYEVCRILRADPQTMHIPVIILSAVHRDPESRIKGLEAGADAFLTKPIEENELMAQIKAMLRIKRAEDVLRQEKEKLAQSVQKKARDLNRAESIHQALLQNIGIGVSLISPDLKILAVNRQMQEWFPDIDIIKNQTCYKALFDPEREDACMECPTQKTFMDGQIHEAIIEIPKEKNTVYYRFVSSPVRDEDSKIVNVIELVDDITERINADKEKTKLEKQLQQAQKMESIGTLAGGIAHDFNNILSPILGYAEMAREDATEGSILQKDLDKMIEATLRARDLVKQILSFSRQSETDLVLFNPSPIIKEVLKLLRSSIPTTIEIKQNLASECGIILADPTLIHQVVMNLCTNAYHAMESSGGILEVLLTRTELTEDELNGSEHPRPGSYVKLTISDTGTGINPVIQHRIFDPYFTTKEQGKGTGMGLAVTHSIVTGLQGFIKLESERGKGSTFQVFFPISAEDAIPAQKEISKTVPKGKEHILFVDDEKFNLETGRDMLERLGYNVSVKENAIEALKAFLAQPELFDLVITDQTMPKMTGEDLGREIMRIRPEIPIILCTGFSSLITEEKAKAMGFREFVMKPMIKMDIAQTIRRVLDK